MTFTNESLIYLRIFSLNFDIFSTICHLGEKSTRPD